MKYNDLPQIAIVPTYNPPVVGVWLYAADWSDVERLDDAIHRWSMRQFLKRVEEL
jgi:hypothetical protein